MGNLRFVVMFSGGALLGIMLGWFLAFPPNDSATAASWAQAVGTVAAIGAAVWVAFREDRRRAAESLAAAQITAVGLTLQLALSMADVAAAKKWFDVTAQFDGNPNGFKDRLRDLVTVEICSKEDRLALVPLPNRCAFNIAAADDRLHAVIGILKEITSGPDLQSPEKRKDRARYIVFLLNDALSLLSLATLECQAASQAFVEPRPKP